MVELTENWRHEPYMEGVLLDLRYTLRQMRQAPGIAIAVVATLAVGLGAALVMYTVLDRILLRFLPYRDPGTLVEIEERTRDGRSGWGATLLDIQQWQRSQAVNSVAFYRMPGGGGRGGFLEGNTGAILVLNPGVSGNLFPTLGVQAALGRTFLEGESGGVSMEDAHTVVLNDVVWRDAFDADPHVLGRTIRLNGVPYTIIGVMPRGFTFPFQVPQSAMVWMPIVPSKADMARVKNETPLYQTIGRLTTRADIRKAETELKGIQAQNALLYTDPDSREHANSIHVERYSDSLAQGDLRQSLLALSGAAGVLWLIACVNATSLLLARATSRRWEIAVRGALGASRWRLAQQSLIEGWILSMVAAVAGVGLAMLTLRMFEYELRNHFTIYAPLVPNLRVLGALLGLTILTATVISVSPALAMGPTLVQRGLSSSGARRTQHRLRASLVIAEIAMSLTLLVACGLLLRTIYALRHVPLGFRTDHIIVVNMSIPAYKYKGEDMMRELYEPLLERVQHLPGVDSATLLSEVPLGKTYDLMFTFGDKSRKNPNDVRHSKMTIALRAVGPEAQRVFGFRMLRGRFFNETDTPTTQFAVVVNRAFVREYEGNDGDPGQILDTTLDLINDQPAVVIGVMNDERQGSVAEPPQPELEIYLPQLTPRSMFYQPGEEAAMDLAVRTRRAPNEISPELRRVMRQASPELGPSKLASMDQIVEDSYGSQQLLARVLGTFGGSALLLCVAGIYGLLAYIVTQRTQEVGIRVALGAPRSHVMAMILWQAGRMLLCGLGLGLLLAYISTSLLRTLLYGVQLRDPWTMMVVSLVLLMSGLAAAYLPARRAARIDPMRALRNE